MLLPLSAGGDQVEPWQYLRAIEEICRHDGPVGWNLFVANSAALIAPFIPLETAKAIYADPRTVISWGLPTQHWRHIVPGAIGSPASGTSPTAAVRPTGWTPTAKSSSRTGRCG
jgi:hypothetical protein